jgi:hypothetical protein
MARGECVERSAALIEAERALSETSDRLARERLARESAASALEAALRGRDGEWSARLAEAAAEADERLREATSAILRLEGEAADGRACRETALARCDELARESERLDGLLGEARESLAGARAAAADAEQLPSLRRELESERLRVAALAEDVVGMRREVAGLRAESELRARALEETRSAARAELESTASAWAARLDAAERRREAECWALRGENNRLAREAVEFRSEPSAAKALVSGAGGEPTEETGRVTAAGPVRLSDEITRRGGEGKGIAGTRGGSMSPLPAGPRSNGFAPRRPRVDLRDALEQAPLAADADRGLGGEARADHARATCRAAALLRRAGDLAGARLLMELAIPILEDSAEAGSAERLRP